MAINERNIRVDIQEGQIAKGLIDTLQMLKKGQSNLKVNLQSEGDKDLLKSLETKISPQVDLTGVKTAFTQIETEYEQLRSSLSKPLVIDVKVGGASGGIEGATRSLQGMSQQVQAATNAGKSLTTAYSQAGQQVSSSVQKIQRQLESLQRTQAKAEAQSLRTTNQTIRGLPVRGFTSEELAAGASTRVDQRLLLRGLDQAKVIPGPITRQSQISPSAAASEYIRQERELERLAKKKEALELSLQDKLADEQRRAALKQQSDLEKIARKANSQNIDISSLRSTNPQASGILSGLSDLQGQLAKDPVRQAEQLVANAARTNRIAKQFESSIGFREFFALNKEERINERLGRIPKILEEYPNVPGLEDRLRLEARTGKLPSRFDVGRLGDPKVATQVAFGAVFGGGRGLASAALGGAIGGVPGALAAATVQQGVDALVGPLVEGLEHRKAEFQEAGSAFEGSILSISAALQQTTEVLGPSGKPLGANNIQGQLSFQEREATKIQLAARKELLPQGIGGSTEATFVRGIVAALGQRGINANSDEVSQIARILGGVIQTQRPQLLENTSLLNRDLQDVLSGLPQASRTILGSLIRTSIPKLAKATTGSDVVAALQNQSAFADVAINSKNPVALQNKLRGAEDQLNTIGGESFLKAQSFGIQTQTNVLQTQALQDASEKLGAALGTLDSAFRIADVSAKSLGADLINLSAGGLQNVTDAVNALIDGTLQITSPVSKLFGPSGGQDLIDERETNKKIATADQLIQEAAAIKARSTASGRINAGLEGVGLNDSIEKFGTERLQSSVNRENTLDRLERLFGTSDRFKELAPAIFSERINILDTQLKERSSIFTGPEGDVASGKIQREDIIPEQLKNASKLAAAASERIDAAIKRIKDADRDKIEISNELEKEQASLRSAQLNRRNNAPGDLVEDARSRVEEAQIKSRIDDLKVARKEKELGINIGDNEIQNLTDQLIDAGRKEVELKDRVVQSSLKETDVVLGRLAKISSSFDTQTGAGSLEEARRALVELNSAAASTAQAIRDIEQELARVAELKDAAAKSRQNTSDPGVQKLRDQQIKDLALKEQELKKRREAAGDTQRNIELQTFRKNLQESDSKNIPLTRERNRLDTFTFAGQLKSIDLLQQEAANTVQSRRAALAQQLAILKNDPTNTSAKSAVEVIQNDIEAAKTQKDIVQPRNRTITQFDRGIARIELDQALKKSSRVIEDESLKRKELNAAVDLSAVKLKNFAADVAATNLGQESELISIADQIRQIDPTFVPASLGGAEGFDKDTQDRLKIGQLAARGNQIARKYTGKDLFAGDSAGLGLSREIGNESELNATSESVKLSKSVIDVSRELSDLAGTFKKARLELSKDVFVTTEKLKDLDGDSPAEVAPTPPSTKPTSSVVERPGSSSNPGQTSKSEPGKSDTVLNQLTGKGVNYLSQDVKRTNAGPGAGSGPLASPPEPLNPPKAPLNNPYGNLPPPPTPDSVLAPGGEKKYPGYRDLAPGKFSITSAPRPSVEEAGKVPEYDFQGQKTAAGEIARARKPFLIVKGTDYRKPFTLTGGFDANSFQPENLAPSDAANKQLQARLDHDKEVIENMPNLEFRALMDRLSKDPKHAKYKEMAYKWRYPPGFVSPNVLDGVGTEGQISYPDKFKGDTYVDIPTQPQTSNDDSQRSRFSLPEFDSSESTRATIGGSTEIKDKINSIEFNQFGVPIREVDPVITFNDGRKRFTKGGAGKANRYPGRSKTFPKIQAGDHNALRADIAADLIDTVNPRLRESWDVDSSNLQGTDLTVPRFPLPNQKQTDFASGIFGASVGLGSFVPGSLDGTPVPSGRTPKVKLPQVPADVQSRNQQSEQNKSLEAKLSALTSAITNLTSSGLKLDSASVNALGSEWSGVFR